MEGKEDVEKTSRSSGDTLHLLSIHPNGPKNDEQLGDQPLKTISIGKSQVAAAARNPSADLQDSNQRRLDRLEWLCFDDKCNRLDAFSCSSTLVSFFTRIHVSWADISPSCSHLMLDSSAGDIKSRLGGNKLRNPAW